MDVRLVKKVHLMCQYLVYTVTPSDKIHEQEIWNKNTLPHFYQELFTKGSGQVTNIYSDIGMNKFLALEQDVTGIVTRASTIFLLNW